LFSSHAACFRSGRRCSQRRFVTVGGHFAFAGRELRAYMLLALLSVAFALLLDRYVRRGTGGPALAAVVCAGALTHYFFVLTALSGAAWAWLDPAARRRAALWIGAGLGGAALWLPWALRQYRQDRYAWIGSLIGALSRTPGCGSSPRLRTPRRSRSSRSLPPCSAP
jgi:hypothetical protein